MDVELLPDVTYVTRADEELKLSRHQRFYLRNSKRLKKEARNRRNRKAETLKNLTRAEQDAAQERRRSSQASYRERNRKILRFKQQAYRQRKGLGDRENVDG